MTRRAGDGIEPAFQLGNVSSRAQARALCCLVQQTVVALFAAPLFVGALSGGTAAAQPRMVDYQSGATLTGTKPTPALRISFSVSLSSSSKPVCLESWARAARLSIGWAASVTGSEAGGPIHFGLTILGFFRAGSAAAGHEQHLTFGTALPKPDPR